MTNSQLYLLLSQIFVAAGLLSGGNKAGLLCFLIATVWFAGALIELSKRR